MAWLHMLGIHGLQGEMPEVVAQGNSNVVELHREEQDVVENRDLPVNRDVMKEGGGAKEKLEECFEPKGMVRIATSAKKRLSKVMRKEITKGLQ